MTALATSSQDNGRPVVVRLRDVSKRYYLQMEQSFLIRLALLRLIGRGRDKEEFWALRDLSLDVYKGESIAFIGHNGAGKSTFLGLVAKTIHPTRGSIEVHGRMGTLLELGAGFHPDLTGYENIYMNASLLGLDRETIEGQVQAIVDFAELDQFINMPLRSYSSGMQIRLGFSVAIHVDPDILIMDEVLAVGDESFQQKCLKKIHEFRDRKKTILFVSHNMTQVKKLCQRAVWLEHGRVHMTGDATEVADAYLEVYG